MSASSDQTPEPAEDETSGALEIISEPTDPDSESPNAEAAKYRTRLRDAESERDALAERVTALQLSRAEDLITRARLKPAAVFAVTTLADLLDESGAVSPEKVAAAVTAAKTTLGIDSGLRVPAEGRNPAAASRGTFAAAFTPPRRPQ
jgi:hypothetical protein